MLASSASSLQPPDDLRVPVVETVLSPREIAQHSFDQTCPVCLPSSGGPRNVDCAWWLEWFALRRWRGLRADWLALFGVSQRDGFRIFPERWPVWSERPADDLPRHRRTRRSR